MRCPCTRDVCRTRSWSTTIAETRNPKSTTAQVKLFRGARPTYASIRSQTAGNYYRGDLTQVAIAKASAILRSQRGKKLKVRHSAATWQRHAGLYPVVPPFLMLAMEMDGRIFTPFRSF